MKVSATTTHKRWAEALRSISLVAVGGFSLAAGETIVHGLIHYVTFVLKEGHPGWAEPVPKLTLAISVSAFAVSVCIQDVIHQMKHIRHNHDANLSADAVDQPSADTAITPNRGADSATPVASNELTAGTRRLIAKSAVIIGLALAFTVMLPVMVLTIIYLGGGLVLVLILCILAVLLGILFGLAVSENAQVESSADYARDVTM